MAQKKKISDAEKEAKKAARKEALKNRPAGQRPNSKQIDVIQGKDTVVKSYGYPLKNKDGYQGVLVTTVLENNEGVILSTSTTFVPGKFTVKCKKGHGTITAPKKGKHKDEDDVAEEETED